MDKMFKLNVIAPMPKDVNSYYTTFAANPNDPEI